jgi:hypothetical protein
MSEPGRDGRLGDRAALFGAPSQLHRYDRLGRPYVPIWAGAAIGQSEFDACSTNQVSILPLPLTSIAPRGSQMNSSLISSWVAVDM